MVEPPKGTESLTIHMVRVLSSPYQSSPLKGPLPMVERLRSSPLLSLMVEHPKGTESLTIHMVRVLSMAALSLMVER
jgi:hypothetical protein